MDSYTKFFLAAIPKDVKKGGTVCKNDSGSGLILKRGNRFVQIGNCFQLTKVSWTKFFLHLKGLLLDRKGSAKVTSFQQVPA